MARKLASARTPELTARQEMRRAKKLIEKQLLAHPCGDCQECCTTRAVEEIEKPEGAVCSNLVEPRSSPRAGCGIYAKRPQSCRDYFCAYRFGVLGGQGAAHRPDVVGIVFDIVQAPPPGVSMVAAREVVPGAFVTSMQQLNEIAAMGHVIYLIQGERRRFMGEESLVRKCVAWSQRHLPIVARD